MLRYQGTWSNSNVQVGIDDLFPRITLSWSSTNHESSTKKVDVSRLLPCPNSRLRSVQRITFTLIFNYLYQTTLSIKLTVTLLQIVMISHNSTICTAYLSIPTIFHAVRGTIRRFSATRNFFSISINTEADGTLALKRLERTIWSATRYIPSNYIVFQCCAVLLSTFGVRWIYRQS